MHPVEALRKYREATGIAARLIIVGMVPNGFTITDPDDAGMMDVVGFDSSSIPRAWQLHPSSASTRPRPRSCAASLQASCEQHGPGHDQEGRGKEVGPITSAKDLWG